MFQARATLDAELGHDVFDMILDGVQTNAEARVASPSEPTWVAGSARPQSRFRARAPAGQVGALDDTGRTRPRRSFAAKTT